MMVMLSTPKTDAGLVEQKVAARRAQELANAEGQPVTIRNATTDRVIAKVRPAKKGKPAKPAAKKAAPAAAKAPRGMVVSILKLASRPKGVTPQELNTLTKWRGAPWRWLFSNPKKNGYCDRWGYRFAVLHPDKDNRRAVAYRVTKK